MKATIGIILIVLGVAVFVVRGISYTTTEEVADIGPVEISKENEHTIPLSPVLGGIALLGGVALTFSNRK